ncbi:class II fructose-bisphosphate aldolase [Vagococcus fluvialis]|uniref:class II fructose-bisphosphate aldolase n=1 Tax=Vagococcus fluvialis TaxID=2738 RepID=UPI003D0CFB37
MKVSLNEILQIAENKNIAIGAFNVPNLESLMAVIEAAEETNSPVIIQHAEVHNHLIPLEIIGPIMIDFAHRAKVPVAVHLDHGTSFNTCTKAMQMGFSSIMYDGSAHNMNDNIKNTQEIVKIAHSLGIQVEAELGSIATSSIGGGEGRTPKSLTPENLYTQPKDAFDFYIQTKVDALAISFGTVHGVYLTEPQLNLNLVQEVKQLVNIPLVMHGGSGVSEKDYHLSITNGIRKINYYTYMNRAGANFIKDLDTHDNLFFDDISIQGKESMKKNVIKAINMFSKK